MNKEILNQLPPDEQPMASRLDSVAEDMQLSQTFEWELENQLIEKYKTKNGHNRPGLFTKIIPALGWAMAAFVAVFLLSWMLRPQIPDPQAGAVESPTPEISFEEQVRQGNICAGPLAVAHNFFVAVTNADKTGFVSIDEQNAIGELRTFVWSPDGKQLAVVGNTGGQGSIYIMDLSKPVQLTLSSAEAGYLMSTAWSRDGQRFVLWSSQNNSTLYLLNADGKELIERKLEMQIFGTPQFAPDGESLMFYGSTPTSAGLFEIIPDSLEIRLVSALMEDENSFAFSPDGTRLAIMEMDRELGEAHLVAQEISTGNKTILATLPIPKGSGSSLPDSANLSWSQDGRFLVFDFGRGASDRAVYLAQADGVQLIKLVESARAPTISADGRCLAFIAEKQIFLLDLDAASSNPATAAPLPLVDLPAGRVIADFRLDKLQWRPAPIP